MKEVHLEEIKSLIRSLSFYKGYGNKAFDKYQLQELYELDIAKRFLTCPYFEMRIKGMKEFKQIVEKICNTMANLSNRYVKQGGDYARYLDLKTFSAWIIKEKVIEFIFKENPHNELIKRSYSILYIMGQETSTFPEEYLQIIWSCCSGEKHEDIVRATYELVCELAKCLAIERLQNLFEKVRAISLKEIDGKTVSFLKDYTINTI